MSNSSKFFTVAISIDLVAKCAVLNDRSSYCMCGKCAILADGVSSV